MIFTPYKDELARITHIHGFNDTDYSLIRLTETMIEKNNIDANIIFRDMLRNEKIVDYEEINNGAKYKVNVPARIFSSNQQCTGLFRHYRVANKRGDRRFSIAKIKNLCRLNYFKTGDLLYLTIVEDKIIAINISESLPTDTILSEIFGENSINEALHRLIPMVKKIARQGYHRNLKGAGKSVAKDAGDTLESLLDIATNNRTNADFEGKIELKTKTYKNKDTLFTKRPLFSGTPIEYLEPNDRSRVSAYTRYYGYDSDKHPNAKSLYITIGSEEYKQNGYGFFLKINESLGRVELWAPSPQGKQAEFSAYWDFSDLKTELYEKYPATLWVSVDKRIVEDMTEFKYSKAYLTRKPQFTTFLSLIKTGVITYDWRGYTSISGTYSGKNHGNAWRIDPKQRSLLFESMTEIDLLDS